MSKIIVFLWFMLSISAVHAQQMLVVENTHNTHRLRYLPGDIIYLKTVHGHVFRDTLYYVDSSEIVVQHISLPFSDIRTVYTTRSGGRIFSQLIYKGGVGYMALDVVNSLIRKDKVIIDSHLLQVGVFTLVGGKTFSYFSLKRHRLGRRYQLRGINFENK